MLESSCLHWPDPSGATFVYRRSTGTALRVRVPGAPRDRTAALAAALEEHGLVSDGRGRWEPAPLRPSPLLDAPSEPRRFAVAGSSSYADALARAVGAAPGRCRALVVATPAYRPLLLDGLAAHRAWEWIAPTFFYKHLLLAGPWLRAGACPCALCLHGRLAAAEQHAALFESQWRAADEAPEQFEAQLPELHAELVEAVAAYLGRGPAGDGAWTRLLRIDLRTGEVAESTLLALPPHAHPRLHVAERKAA